MKIMTKKEYERLDDTFPDEMDEYVSDLKNDKNEKTTRKKG